MGQLNPCVCTLQLSGRQRCANLLKLFVFVFLSYLYLYLYFCYFVFVVALQSCANLLKQFVGTSSIPTTLSAVGATKRWNLTLLLLLLPDLRRQWPDQFLWHLTMSNMESGQIWNLTELLPRIHQKFNNNLVSPGNCNGDDPMKSPSSNEVYIEEGFNGI